MSFCGEFSNFKILKFFIGSRGMLEVYRVGGWLWKGFNLIKIIVSCLKLYEYMKFLENIWLLQWGILYSEHVLLQFLAQLSKCVQ
jgi:hypothetical protein